MNKTLRVGFTHGDINGIGYEQLLKAMGNGEILELCTPVIFGASRAVETTRKALGLPPIEQQNIVATADAAIAGRINIVDVVKDSDITIEWGRQTESSIRAEADSLTAALNAYRRGEINVLVAAPGQLNDDLTSHALCDFIRQALQSDRQAFDWIVNDTLRTVAIHQDAATTELGEGLAQEAATALVEQVNEHTSRDFGFIRPRIGIVSPVDAAAAPVAGLPSGRLLAFNLKADERFYTDRLFEHYDALLFVNADDERRRLLDMVDCDTTYGYVSGLPLVLTYPMVSVAYDIAGRGTAPVAPMRKAIYAAIDIWRERQTYRRATQNPLPRLWVSRGRDDVKLDLTKDE